MMKLTQNCHIIYGISLFKCRNFRCVITVEVMKLLKFCEKFNFKIFINLFTNISEHNTFNA